MSPLSVYICLQRHPGNNGRIRDCLLPGTWAIFNGEIFVVFFKRKNDVNKIFSAYDQPEARLFTIVGQRRSLLFVGCIR